MSTKFERPAVQTWIEKKLGCNDLSQWSTYSGHLASYKITPTDLTALKGALISDSGSYLIKGMLSLFDAIESVNREKYSWAIVKQYYSIFYLNRASLGTKNYALIRNKNWFLLKLGEGEGPNLKSGKKYRNDHDAVISTYIDLYETSDYLQSNTVEGVNSYKWLAERRNQVNYHQAGFTDPNVPLFIEGWEKLRKTRSIKQILDTYKQDGDVRIFQPEHAWIAIPLLRAQNALRDFVQAKMTINIPASQLRLLLDVLEGKDFLNESDLLAVFRPC